MNRHLFRVLRLSIGQAGANLVALISLAVPLVIAGYELSLVIEVGAALVLVRTLYGMTRGQRWVIPECAVRRKSGVAFLDEAIAWVGMAAAAFVLKWPVSVGIMAISFVLDACGQCVLSLLVYRLLDEVNRRRLADGIVSGRRQVLIVGTGMNGKRTADLILDAPEIDTAVAGFMDYHRRGLWRYRDIPFIGHPDEACRLAANCQVDAILIAVEPEDMMLTVPLFSLAEKMGVAVCLVSQMYDPAVARCRMEFVRGRPVMVYRAVPENVLILVAKALVDRIGALCGLILLSPLMAVTALAIKIDSRGPVFFWQTRSGLNGRLFRLWKFRTMCCQAETMKEELRNLNEMSGPVFKVRNDPRVTTVGRILRRTSLDELPQLLNVLKGDMSLVGPRPPLPHEVAQYEPWQHRRLSVKPGVTCTWQVNGRNAIDFEDWMKMDLEYIDNWSLWKDAKILAQTLPAVIKGEGAS